MWSLLKLSLLGSFLYPPLSALLPIIPIALQSTYSVISDEIWASRYYCFSISSFNSSSINNSYRLPQRVLCGLYWNLAFQTFLYKLLFPPLVAVFSINPISLFEFGFPNFSLHVSFCFSVLLNFNRSSSIVYLRFPTASSIFSEAFIKMPMVIISSINSWNDSHSVFVILNIFSTKSLY